MMKKTLSAILLTLSVLLPTSLWAQEPYAVLSEDNTVLTFCYDTKKEEHNGMSVGPFNSESERPWHEMSERIENVIFDSAITNDTTITSTAYWFKDFTSLNNIDGIQLLNTKFVTNMRQMFQNCSALTGLVLDSFNTTNVTTMHGMFYGCSNLQTLKLGTFSTDKVTDTSYMFEGCSSLTALDLSSFTVVRNPYRMFNRCSNLKNLDLSNFKTEDATSMRDMFEGCSSLTALDLSSFQTNQVTDMYAMFANCSSLTTIYVGDGWSTEHVNDSGNMFSSCTKLTGGKGTTFDWSHEDASYAHIDEGPSNPGYFTDINAPVPVDTVATPTFSLSGDDLIISTATEGATISCSISERDNFYLVGGNGVWGNDKSQRLTLTGYVGWEPAIYSYILTGGGEDLWFAFGDETALDAIDEGYWQELFGTTGNSEDLSGTFDRRYNLSGDNSFHVDGKSPYYRFTINMNNWTYEITPLDTIPGDEQSVENVFTYTEPIPLERDMVIKAYAHKDGMYDSESATLDYPYGMWMKLMSMRNASQTMADAYTNRTEVADSIDKLKALIALADEMYNNQRLTLTVDEINGLYDEMQRLYSDIEAILRERTIEVVSSDKYYVIGEVNGWHPEQAIQNMFYRDASGNFTYTTDWGTTHWALKLWDTRSIGDWTSAWGATIDGSRDESGILTSINSGAFSPPAIATSSEGASGYSTLTFNAKTHEFSWTRLENQQPTEYRTVGIVGSFNGWANDIEMTQVAPHNWYIRYTFSERTDFKLRANKEWDTNWGYNPQSPKGYYCINGYNGDNIGVEADEYDIYLNDITGQINLVPTREFSVLTPEEVEIAMMKSGDAPNYFGTECSLRGGLGYYSLTSSTYNNNNEIIAQNPNAPAILPETEGNVTIPSVVNGLSVVSIPSYAFGGTRISAVILPESIVDYQENAFADCANLTTITSLSQRPVAIPDATFSNTHYENAVLYVPTGCVNIYRAADGWKNFSRILEIGDVVPADTVATPTFSWEGDMLTIHCATEGATILYSAQTADEKGVYGADAFALYEGPFEYRSDALLKARAIKDGMEDSDTLTLEYPYTAWQRLREAIEFSVITVMMCVDNQKVQQEDVMRLKYMADEAESYYNERQLKRDEIERMAGDLMVRSAELRSQLEAVEYAYDAGNGVLTISGGTTVAEALEAAGGRDKIAESLTAIIWNNTTPLAKSDLQGLNNPNMLIYVSDASFAPANRDNIIVGNDSTGYMAKNILLTDVTEGNGNFYCPREFKAEMISYTHEYRQTTEPGVARGWETIALPFTVQTIMHEKNGLIAPFGNDASGKHFWLRQLSERGLTSATVIEANMPYLISMPNSNEYPAEYNQAGRVTFSAQDAIVPQTEINVMEAHDINDNMVMFVPCFQSQSAEEQIYALNVGEQREGYPEGSVFVANYRAVRPFEAFTVHHGNGPAPQYIPIFDMNGGTTGIEDVRSKMEDERGSIWYDLHGRKLQQKPSRKGVYILNGQKTVIK